MKDRDGKHDRQWISRIENDNPYCKDKDKEYCLPCHKTTALDGILAPV